MKSWTTLMWAIPILVILYASGLLAQPTRAHGKKINIDVTTSARDVTKPLVKSYRALLTYEDGDKVESAKLILTASRVGRGETVGPITFVQSSQVGVYEADVTYPAYGQWNIKFRVVDPGEGEAELLESLSPPSPAQTDTSSARVVVSLGFDARDALNVSARLVHALAAAVWFGSIVAVFAAPRLIAIEEWRWALARVARKLPWLFAGLWLLLLMTGAYLATNNVPNRAPGILAPETLLRLPWGAEYLTVFRIKMLLVVTGIALGFVLAYTLRQSSNASVERVNRLLWLNMVVGLLIFASVVVLGYFHNLSHLGLLR